MNGVGMKNKAGNAITEADLRDLYDTIPQQNKDARQNSVLYHPTDRDSIVWPDEPALSIIASTLNRSLIILSPFVAANGAGSNRMYDRTNRAPIYARWSTGRQGLKPPLILGCLPKQVSNAEPRIKAMWFSVQPDQTRDPSWARSIYAGENIKTLADRIGFPITSFNGKDHVFLWALVSLQRRIVLGAIPDDTNLGCWLWQFGKHLVDNCIGWTDPVPAPFKFDAAKDPKYNKQFQSGYLSFQTLSCLVLSPRMTVNNSSTEQYAALWDQAIDAQIVYKRNQTDQNWDDFAKKMEKARHIPL
ncbi:hypothetical protein N0V86_004432 [Didymella sp. IMI 355093]|nr:hypothetical protein N0V86_004432 [Didymella sp. IMI 355093]